MKAVINMYKEVLSPVKVEGENSKEFAVRAGMHQGSILCYGDGCGDREGGEGGMCPDVCR